MKKIVIKGEVSSGQFSFLSCKNLVEIVIEGIIKNVTATSFFGCKSLGILRIVGPQPLNGNAINTIINSRIEFDKFGNAYSNVFLL